MHSHKYSHAKSTQNMSSIHHLMSNYNKETSINYNDGRVGLDNI